MFSRHTYKNHSDEELFILRFDSKKAFAELYNRYYKKCLGLCMYFIKDIEIAEDICAEIFSNLYQNKKEYDIKSFKAWFYQLSRNACLQYLRKQKDYILISVHQEHLLVNENNIDLEKEYLLDLIPELIEKLNKNQAICVQLFYFKHLSYEDIAEKLNISIKEVKSHLQNGKRNLKISIEKRQHGGK